MPSVKTCKVELACPIIICSWHLLKVYSSQLQGTLINLTTEYTCCAIMIMIQEYNYYNMQAVSYNKVLLYKYMQVGSCPGSWY